MKNYKKVLAGALATTMVMGSTSVVFAGGSEGSGTGEGELEGVLNSNVYDVVLPTVTDTTFDFILDPEGLIKATAGERYGDTEQFEDGASLFFKNSAADDDGNTYTKSSDVLTVINKSSTDVTLNVTATVTNLDTTAVPLVSATTDFAADDKAVPEIYLALTDTETSPNVVPILTTGAGDTAVNQAKIADKTITGANTEYTVKWNEETGKYEKALKPEPKDPENPTKDEQNPANFKSFAFKLTGACNTGAAANWAGVEDIQPKVDVVWAVTVPYDTVTGPQVTMTADGLITLGNMTADDNFKDFTLSDGTNTFNYTLIHQENTVNSNNWTAENGGTVTIQLSETWLTNWTGQPITATLMTDSGSKTITVTLN